MDFPTFEENANRPRQALTLNVPSATDLVSQQWRDVASLGLEKRHPLSINRDSAVVTSDPYAA